LWWLGIGFAVLVIVGLVVPSPATRKRAKEIAKPARILPSNLTQRDIAYTFEYYRIFGLKEFRLSQIEGKSVSRATMSKFGFRSGRLDDKGILRSRLPENGLLHSRKAGVYQLTGLAESVANEYTSR
jgi:hypothetical protein